MDSHEEALLLLLLLKRRRRRRRSKRKYWVHPILELREHGQLHYLFMELRNDEENFFNYIRMSMSSFDELNNILKSKIKVERQL